MGDCFPINLAQGAQYDNCCKSYPEDCRDDVELDHPDKCQYWNCCDGCDVATGRYWEDAIKREQLRFVYGDPTQE